MSFRVVFCIGLAACQGCAPPMDEEVSGSSADVMPLEGPFPDVVFPRECTIESDLEPGLCVLGETRGPGGVTVGLRKSRGTPSAAACAVTVSTAAGLFVGPEFLCEAFRSDERARTDRVALEADGSNVTVRFRVSTSWRTSSATKSPIRRRGSAST